MITCDEFMKLTDQAKWDLYCLLVSECGDSDEVDDADEDTLRLNADELLAVPPIPHDEPAVNFIVPGDGFITRNFSVMTPAWEHLDATSPQYHQQFHQYGNTGYMNNF